MEATQATANLPTEALPDKEDADSALLCDFSHGYPVRSLTTWKVSGDFGIWCALDQGVAKVPLARIDFAQSWSFSQPG